MSTRLAFLTLFSFACACARDPGPPQAEESAPCLELHRRDESGACVPLLPSGECAPGSFLKLGSVACVPVGVPDCGPLFEREADGWGCREIAATTCPAAHMPKLGSRTCTAVGPTRCPGGLPLAADGFCPVPAVPTCSGAQRETLDGQCLPLGNCGAPPPPAATLFVDRSAEPDATHFHTFAGALAAAPAGATIFLAPGTYSESVVVKRSVTLIGGCAERVVFSRGPADIGLQATGAGVAVAIRGLTFEGHEAAVVVSRGAKVELQDSLITGSQSVGAFALGTGSELHLDRVVVENTTRGAGTETSEGVLLMDGATGRISESAFRANQDVALHVLGTGTTAHVQSSVFRQGVSGPGGTRGYGLLATEGATLTLGNSVLSHFENAAVVSLGATVEMSVVSVGQTTSVGDAPLAGVATSDSVVRLEDVSLFENAVPSLLIDGRSSAELVRVSALETVPRDQSAHLAVGGEAKVEVRASRFQGPTLYGIACSSAELVLEDVYVRDTRDVAGGGAGIAAFEEGAITCRGCTVTNAGGTSLKAVSGSSFEGSEILVRGGTFDAASTVFTGGVAVTDGSSLVLKRSAIVEAPAAGVAVAGPALPGSKRTGIATARLEDVVIRDGRPSYAGNGRALNADYGGAIHANRVSIIRASGVGAAAWSKGSFLELSDSTIAHSVPVPGELGYGAALGEQATGSLTRVAVVANRAAGLISFADAVVLEVVDSYVAGTERHLGEYHGHGVFMQGGARFRASGSTFSTNVNVGLGFASSSALVTRSLVEGNGAAVHLQGSTRLVEVPSSDGQVVPGEVRIGSETVFLENKVRHGAGDLPLIDPLPR